MVPSSQRAARLDAWTAYLQGRSEYLKFSNTANLRAREHYLRALEVDPTYAEAIVALAHTYIMEMLETPTERWESVQARSRTWSAKLQESLPACQSFTSFVRFWR